MYGVLTSGLLLTACSADELVVPENTDNGVSDKDQTLYVSLAISGDSGTRAAGEDGNPVDPDDFTPAADALAANESAVESAYFVFYDNSGTQVGEIARVTVENGGAASTGNSVERYYGAVVPVKLHKGEALPTKVICYVNPISPAALQNPLSQVQLQTRQTVMYKTAENQIFFPMSNSVHYHGTGNTSPTVAVDITHTDDNKIFYESKEEAETVLKEYDTTGKDHVIAVNVERYAAKVTFGIQEGATNDVFETTSDSYNNGDKAGAPVVSLKFNPQKWVVNAECKDTYVVKSMRQYSSSGDILGEDFTYDRFNTLINAMDPQSVLLTQGADLSGVTVLDNANMWNWNNENYHRCYWAASPAYFTRNYPEVSTDYIKNAASHPQKYYTFEDILGTGGIDLSSNTYYAKETTFGVPALQSPNPAAAAPAIVIAGNYSVTVNGTAYTKQDGSDFDGTFYTYLTNKDGKPCVYFNQVPGNETGNSLIEGTESIIKRMISQTTILFKKEAKATGDSYVRLSSGNENDLKTLVKALEIVRPESDEITGSLKIPSRYVTLQLRSGETTQKSQIYMANGKGFREIVPDGDTRLSGSTQEQYISWSEANKHLLQQVGFATKYHEGYAYFNIPIKHLGWYRNGNKQKDEKTINWNLVRVGDFGLVRNHSYNINVTKISGLGTGIGNPDDPIIPPTDTQDYYVAYRLNILKWAIVPQQNVEL